MLPKLHRRVFLDRVTKDELSIMIRRALSHLRSRWHALHLLSCALRDSISMQCVSDACHAVPCPGHLDHRAPGCIEIKLYCAAHTEP